MQKHIVSASLKFLDDWYQFNCLNLVMVGSYSRWNTDRTSPPENNVKHLSLQHWGPSTGKNLLHNSLAGWHRIHWDSIIDVIEHVPKIIPLHFVAQTLIYSKHHAPRILFQCLLPNNLSHNMRFHGMNAISSNHGIHTELI